jgi:large subunit ribosomal protein L6
MSRVGKKPIPLPDKLEVNIKDRRVTVKGAKGTLSHELHPFVDAKIKDGLIYVDMLSDDRKAHAFQGLTRSLLANMVTGTTQGFERTLEINGIGYRAELKGNTITFNLGYSNPVNFELPKGITAQIDKNTVVKLSSCDKEQLGHTAAAIRKLRPPEPYKGKGIKYAEERIQRKAGKTGTT